MIVTHRGETNTSVEWWEGHAQARAGPGLPASPARGSAEARGSSPHRSPNRACVENRHPMRT